MAEVSLQCEYGETGYGTFSVDKIDDSASIVVSSEQSQQTMEHHSP